MCAMSRRLLRETLAEFFGTFILIVFGVGVVAPLTWGLRGPPSCVGFTPQMASKTRASS